jgi:hypothetical protein
MVSPPRHDARKRVARWPLARGSAPAGVLCSRRFPRLYGDLQHPVFEGGNMIELGG